MSFTCNFCNNTFSQKCNLHKHLTNNKCKLFDISNIIKINSIIEEQNIKLKEQDIKLIEQNIEIKKYKIEIEEYKKQSVTKNINCISGNNNNNFNNINMKIEININPITKLDIKHIENDKLKRIIEEYDQEKQIVCGVDKFSSDKMNLLLSNYIKEMLCDTEHPENHAVKYVKKHPPTYNTCIEDIDGNTVSVIKGLKDTCELLTDPILDQLKIKLREFIMTYKGDTEPEFDFGLYENVILELRRELNKQNVKKALKTVLKNDILNNIEMKLTLLEMK